MKYILGKVVGFAQGMIVTTLGVFAVSGFMLLDKEFKEKKVNSIEDATKVGVEVGEQIFS